MTATGPIMTILGGVAILASLVLPAGAETALERGKYLATIMDCGGCHTTGNLIGKPDPAGYVAGSDIGWFIPGLGVFYPSNLTPDPETGLGRWTKADIIKVLRTGVTPEGREVAPMMPWRAYRTASDADLDALASYLRSVPAVHHALPGPTKLEEVKTPYFTVAMPPK